MDFYLDEISNKLQPYHDIVAHAATILTGLQMLSPIAFLLTIRKKGTTKGISFLPFIMGVVPSSLGLRFGQLIGDFVIMRVHSAGLILGSLYIWCFLYYTPIRDRPSHYKKIVLGVIFAVTALIYTFLEDPKYVQDRFGKFMTFLMFCFILSPVLELKTVFRNKSTEHLPFPMIFVGTFVTITWLLYGFIINNIYMILQTFIGLIVCVGQLMLFVVFPSKSTEKID